MNVDEMADELAYANTFVQQAAKDWGKSKPHVQSLVYLTASADFVARSMGSVSEEYFERFLDQMRSVHREFRRKRDS
jgi:hypothetical protein